MTMSETFPPFSLQQRSTTASAYLWSFPIHLRLTDSGHLSLGIDDLFYSRRGMLTARLVFAALQSIERPCFLRPISRCMDYTQNRNDFASISRNDFVGDDVG